MSELRDYVLEKFSGGQEYSREDITKFINQKFGEGTYTPKQLQNLLYNLTKQNKIERTKKHSYKKTKSESQKSENYANDSTFTIEQYIDQLKRICKSVNDDLSKKDFLERYKGLNLNSLNQVYYMNKKILKDISECEKKI